MSDMLFGWELTYKNVESSLETNTDVLIAFIHFILLKKNFKCIGIGDDKTLTEADKQNQSELLPDGWNQMGGIYKIRYISNDKLYILQALLSEDLLIANLLEVETLHLSNVAFVLDETVTAENRTAGNAIKSPSVTLDTINKDLIEPVFNGTQENRQTQTEEKSQTEEQPQAQRQERRDRLIDPLQIGPPRRPNPDDYYGAFPDVGRGDLDPFGRGGGNLFDPNGMPPFAPRLPGRGSFPGRVPGARFDPYGPPTGNRFDPNPDHFRPPGYDDMFM